MVTHPDKRSTNLISSQGLSRFGNFARLNGLRLSILALTALVVGCLFDPPKGKVKTPPPTIDQSSPALTLQTLQTAYANRDSNLVKQIYDPNYSGTSRDLNDPPLTQLLTFSYTDEVEHIATLARKSSVSSATLTFGSLNRQSSDDLAHPEYALFQMPGNNIQFQIVDGPTTYTLVSDVGETITFRLKPISPASTPTDTLWKIISW